MSSRFKLGKSWVLEPIHTESQMTAGHLDSNSWWTTPAVAALIAEWPAIRHAKTFSNNIALFKLVTVYFRKTQLSLPNNPLSVGVSLSLFPPFSCPSRWLWMQQLTTENLSWITMQLSLGVPQTPIMQLLKHSIGVTLFMSPADAHRPQWWLCSSVDVSAVSALLELFHPTLSREDPRGPKGQTDTFTTFSHCLQTSLPPASPPPA